MEVLKLWRTTRLQRKEQKSTTGAYFEIQLGHIRSTPGHGKVKLNQVRLSKFGSVEDR